MNARPTVTVVPTDDLRAALEEARASGRVAQTNWTLPDEPWDLSGSGITCVGELTETTAHDAVLAVLRGVDAAIALPEDAWTLPLVRDLTRLAVVAVGEPERPPAASVLNEDQLRLLELLGEGLSIPQAASQLFLSVRTAERRIGAARRLLGVRTTAEAVLAVGITR